ncbi:MAG TPA: Na-translocating system protein MpsC family protein [Solirubrobacterales bacterium]|nr:Na-translocating system protein MpsC family protein [Solirubrobacterales bacterium]
MEGSSENRPDSHTAAISREVVRVLKGAVGRGPTKARTYLHDDSVMVLLREGHTKSEETMFEGGGERAVAQGRVDLSEVLREPLIEVIERNLGRKVVGFMSSSQQHPDLLSLVFVLDSSPLLTLVDGEDAA